MSKDRARRRAEREAALAAEKQRLARTRARRAALRAPVDLVRRLVPSRRPRLDSALARHRREQDGVLLAGLLAAHVALWLYVPSWWVRGGALVATVLLWPVLVVVLFDRRASR